MARLMQRVSHWATIKKLTEVADLLFKCAALVVALAAANFFFFQPHVDLRTSAQAFIDPIALNESYAKSGQDVPAVVEEVVEEYNRRNRLDLASGVNATNRSRPSIAELCASMRTTVEDVFPEADCAASNVVVGRGRYYERLLLDRNRAAQAPLGTPQLRDALRRIRVAEYRRARTQTVNAGNAKAANVRIRISDGFVPRSGQANDPYSLEAGQQFRRDFETARGDYEEHPKLEFGVDWERAGLGSTAAALWLVVVMLVLLAFVIVNDIVRSTRETAAHAPHISPHDDV